jgi:hypothetical protein
MAIIAIKAIIMLALLPPEDAPGLAAALVAAFAVDAEGLEPPGLDPVPPVAAT